jgi:hypothetical protein
MSFLHCHTPNCHWEQDDFYSLDGYNPAEYLKSWMEQLCADDVDEQFSTDIQFVKELGPISKREVIAQEFEKFADRIRKMPWVTWEQWERDRETAVCPKCGQRNFDID